MRTAAEIGIPTAQVIGVVSVFLHCLVDYPIQRPALGGLFFVLLGVLAANEKNLDL